VKICSLYGDGFYYLPGTDTCIKLGGFLRAETNFNAGGSFTTFVNGANAQFFRGGDQTISRARGVMTFDVREQTDYGVLRSFVAGGWQYSSNDAPTLSLPGTSVPSGGGAAAAAAAPNTNSNLYLLRAFVQYAGFTFGKTASAFDFFNTPRYSYQTEILYRDAGGVGVNTVGYTQEFGAGISATIAAEDNTQFSHPVKDLNQAFGGGATAGSTVGFGNFFPILAAGGPTNGAWNNAGNLVPDFTGNIRVDQVWGAAQIMGGLHEDRARYYQATANGLVAGVAYPADKWGWAIGAGIELNLPWNRGDSFAIQTQYCVGWSERCYDNSGTWRADLAWSLVNSGTIGLGWLDNAFMANTAATGATGLQLSTMWNVYAAIQHYWVPNVRTSLYGGYVTYQANSSAVDTLVCAPSGFGPGCADWAAWQIGSRTLWNPTKNLDIGVDVQYTALSHSAFAGGTTTFAPGGAAPHTFTIGSTNVLSAIVRVQRNFLY
jgi:Porin subfamily